MEAEICNVVKVGIIVSASLTYCYFISSRIPRGMMRLLFFLPVISIFPLISLLLSTVFFQFNIGLLIGWLATFKLLLIAFGQDDYISRNPSISLFHFILLTVFPVKIKETPCKNTDEDEETPSPYNTITFVGNVLVLSFVVQMYVNYKKHTVFTNPVVIQSLYSSRMTYGIQVHFAMFALLAKSLLRQDVEPHFNNPHLATSLQNFWGKRWNLMTHNVLRRTIYEPSRSLFTLILGRKWATNPAILVTFVVSGLMHEMVYFYISRQWPTWEVTWLFVIHGVCVAIEIEVKKKASKSGWKLSPLMTTPLTIGFVVVTVVWLCHVELIRCGADAREIDEYFALVDHVKRLIRTQRMFPTSLLFLS